MGWTAAAEVGGELLLEEGAGAVAAGAAEGGATAAAGAGAAEGGAAAAGAAEGAAGGAGAGAAAGTGTAVGAANTLMPAAVAESGGSLAAQGLVQTGPGVFEALNAPAQGASLAGTLANVKAASTIISPVASLAATASNIAASRRGGGRPTVLPPVTMPTFGNPNTIAGQRSSIVEQLRRQGRASTILTGSDDKLGG